MEPSTYRRRAVGRSKAQRRLIRDNAVAQDPLEQTDQGACGIAEYKPPTFAAPLLGHRCEQAPRLRIGKRKQCEFLASVKRGDDPRRPTAKPSAARIEQNWARDVIGVDYPGVQVFRPVPPNGWRVSGELRAEFGTTAQHELTRTAQAA